MSITLNLQDPTGFRARDFTNSARGGSFATVQVTAQGGTVDIFLSTVAECDELIKAAVEAKRLLSPPEPPDDAFPVCPATREMPGEGTVYCTREPGHPGRHQAGPLDWTGDTSVTVTDEAPAPAPHGAPVIVAVDEASAEWAAVLGPYCTAGYEPIPGHSLLCELRPGHDGPHRSLGYQDGGADITWTDASLDVAAGADPFAIPANRIGSAS